MTGRRAFTFTVGIGWILLTIAGIYYARAKGIPAAVAAPLIAAFLVEYFFYLVPGFEGLRNWLSDRIPPRTLALGLAISALAPYLIYSLPSGQFRLIAAARLAAFVLVVSFWYILRRPAPASDLALLALVAAALVAKFFRQIYISPVPQVSILGQLMLIRLVASVMLMIREVEGTGFGFLPTAKDWKIGLRNFLWFLPIGVALMAGLGMLRLKTSWMELAFAPLQFLGILWVVALSEEFLARGLLQRWIADWTGRPRVALALASAAFGATHLWFPPGFPNWRIAIIASVLGWFCGKSYEEAGGVRAAMVTHALIVTTWRTVLS
jgi:membrane protease YdiL (CAAX protease family)